MTCIHLKEIYRICADKGLVLGRTDLVRMVCKECGEQEVCPANSIENDEFAAQVTPQVTITSMNTHFEVHDDGSATE